MYELVSIAVTMPTANAFSRITLACSATQKRKTFSQSKMIRTPHQLNQCKSKTAI